MNALLAIGIITVIAFLTGLLLTWFAARFPSTDDPLVTSIDALLPQTQCAQCGYPGCRPYAEAIAHGQAEINQCPPGGDQTIQKLAALLDRTIVPLDSSFGETKAEAVAIIEEEDCIGCTLCIHACPVDAIVGASRYMHTVIASECTGCELCLPPCPVDCITLIPAHRTPL